MGLKSILKTTIRPLIVGHRGMGTSVNGGISLYVENSVESFQKALEAGCDGVELDVFLTLDNQLLVIHGTYDGDMSMNVEGRSGPIESYTGSLSNLPLKLPENTAHKLQKAPTVPSLKEVLDSLSKKLSGGNLFVNVELKGNKRALSNRVLGLLKEYNVPILVSSFNYTISDLSGYYNLYTPPQDLLSDLVDNKHDIDLGLLFDLFGGLVAKAEFFLSALARYKASWLILSDNTDVLCPTTQKCANITSLHAMEFIDLLHSKGYYVGIYFSTDVEDEEAVKSSCANGLDMLIVNQPAKALEIKNKLI